MCTTQGLLTTGVADLWKHGTKAFSQNNLAPQAPKAPKAPSTQQAKLPDQGMRNANNARMRAQQLAGVNAGLPSTLLTGSSGIETGSLNLGRSSLLG